MEQETEVNDQQGAETLVSIASRELNPVNRLLDELGGRSIPGETCSDRLIASLWAVPPPPQSPFSPSSSPSSPSSSISFTVSSPCLPSLPPPPLPLPPPPSHLQSHLVSCGLLWWLRQ